MAKLILPNSSNFLGIALVINRSRDGPRFVFHYPPSIPPVYNDSEFRDTQDADDDLFIERASGGTSKNDQLWGTCPPTASIAPGVRVADPHTHYAAWEFVVGFPTKDLENLLTPGRSFHERMFQVSLDPVYCVANPIHVPENGIWGKPKPSVKLPDNQDQEDPNLIDNIKVPSTQPSTDEKKSTLAMFNLVVFLHPEGREARELIDTMYQHIITKVNEALKSSQQQCDFVWKESKKILQLKEQGVAEKTPTNVLWARIITESSLAASLKEVYEAITQHKIATVVLDVPEGPPIRSRVQVPMPSFVEDISENNDEATKGFWLTTAYKFREVENKNFLFAKNHVALLLLHDEEKVLSEIQESEQCTKEFPRMAEFVRVADPSLSLHQIAHSGTLAVSEMQDCMQSLVHWRQAIAIPPLHTRDTYVLSPNCDFSRLPAACTEWKKTFPEAPSLPSFLADLSYAPRPYKHFCPAKRSRIYYLEMLAWLMRWGWVTQLCTFAYVVVWPEIIHEVESALEEEALEVPSASSSEITEGKTELPKLQSTIPLPSAAPLVGDPGNDQADSSRNTHQRAQNITDKATTHTQKTSPIRTLHPSTNNSPHLVQIEPYIILDPRKATAKEALYLAAIRKRLRDGPVYREAASGETDSISRSPEAHSSNTSCPQATLAASLLSCGPKPEGGRQTPTFHESDNRGPVTSRQQLVEAWDQFLCYFNGRFALEHIALVEDKKRKETWNLLEAMCEYLLTMRHW